jgi:hypothetical protein
MYTLCLAGIVGLGLGATGCGSGSGHGGQYFDAAWSLAWAGGGSVSCTGAGVVEVDLDVQDFYNGAVYHDQFDCAAYGGMSQILPVDDYTVALRAYDDANVQVGEWDFTGTYPIDVGVVTNLPDITLPISAH